MEKQNDDIRLQIAKAGVKQYQVAETMHTSESALSTLLRRPLAPDRRQKIIDAIEETRIRIWGE